MTRKWLRRGLAASSLAAALALIVAGCGSDGETTAPPIRPVPATAPGQTNTASTETTTEQTETSSGGGVSPTGETTTEATETTETGGEGGGGSGGISPDVDPSQPDSSTNDIPAQPGTPQGNFEQYCKQNPGACGD